MDISDVTSTAYLTPGNLLHHTKQCLLDRYGSVIAMKVVVVVASSLSILGALAIILTSYCKGERKTKDEALHETTGLQNPAQTDDDATDIDVKEKRGQRKRLYSIQLDLLSCAYQLLISSWQYHTFGE